MLSLADVAEVKVDWSKDLLVDQTFKGLTVRFNTAGIAFDADGLGSGASATSTLCLVNVGGFADQRVTGIVKWIAPSTAVAHEVGVVARSQTVEVAGETDYYFARIDNGVAKLTRVLGGVFSNLAQSAFVLPINTTATVTLTCVGDAISASFDAGGSPATVNLASIDANIPDAGLMGFKSISSTIACSSIQAEEL